MATQESVVLFRSRSGVTLEVRGNVLYSENIAEVKRALNEDLKGPWIDRQLAKSYLKVINQLGL